MGEPAKPIAQKTRVMGFTSLNPSYYYWLRIETEEAHNQIYSLMNLPGQMSKVLEAMHGPIDLFYTDVEVLLIGVHLIFEILDRHRLT